MATTLTEQDGDKVLEVAASGKLTHRDYEQIVPTFERLVKQHGKRGGPHPLDSSAAKLRWIPGSCF